MTNHWGGQNRDTLVESKSILLPLNLAIKNLIWEIMGHD